MLKKDRFSRMRFGLALGIVVLISCCYESYAQQIFKGIVVDSATFAPLPYVSVQLKTTPKGTTTDAQGNFGIVASPNDTLVFSLIGYARLEIPLFDYETGLILLPERSTLLKAVTITDAKVKNPYEGMFDDENAGLIRKKLPFWYTKSKKQKVWVGRWRAEDARVKTYVDLVISNPDTKAGLMKKYNLTEEKYYQLLTKFNEQHYHVMYYLTSVELESLLYQFFEREH